MSLNTISVATSTTTYFSSPPKYTFDAPGQPLVQFQVVQGTGTSAVNTTQHKGILYLPARSGTPGDFDDFDDLHEDVPNTNVHPTFQITYDTSNNHITDVSWTV